MSSPYVITPDDIAVFFVCFYQKMQKTILEYGQHYNEGFTVPMIVEHSGIARQNVHRALKSLLRKNFIAVKSAGKPVFFVLTATGLKALKNPDVITPSDGIAGGRRTLNLHKSEILLPVLSGDIGAIKGSESKLNNWIAKYVDPGVDLPGISSLRVNGKKSVTFFLERSALDFGPDFEREYFSKKYEAVALVKAWLFSKYQIRTGTPVECQEELESSAKEYGARIDSHKTAVRRYGVSARGAFGNVRAGGDDSEAWAKIDRSKWDNPLRSLNVESNTRDYMALLLDMPIEVAQLRREYKRDQEVSRELIGDVSRLIMQVRGNLSSHRGKDFNLYT